VPENTTIPPITVHKNAEGDTVLLLPDNTWYEEDSNLDDGTIRLFLDDKQIEALQKEISAYYLELLIEKVETALQKLPRESIRRDLGRAGVKVMRRLSQMRKSKDAAEEAMDHAMEILTPLLDKFSLGK
jgi:hypothetical protein